MNDRSRSYATSLIVAAAVFSLFPASAQGHQPANWSTHELDFQYMGFSSRYSCTGLETSVRQILLQLGARDDKSLVTPGACSAIGDRPSRISGVEIKATTLQAAADVNAPAVDAYWKQVTIGGSLSDADCELIEQVKNEILHLFTTRNVKDSGSPCFPHQATLIAPRLTLEVLSVPEPPK